jgi:hypothetical protein
MGTFDWLYWTTFTINVVGCIANITAWWRFRKATARLDAGARLYLEKMTAFDRPAWNYDMSAAPKDGTLLQLLLDHSADDGTGECDGGFEDALRTRVMGFNNGDNDGQDRWMFPGWDWCQDCIIPQGCGTPIAWAPMIERPAELTE